MNPASVAPPKGVSPPSAGGARSGFLSDVIVELGFADRETVEQAVRAARSPGSTVARVLVEAGAVSEEQLARATAERYGIAFIDLDSYKIDAAASNLIKPSAAKRYQAVPVGFVSGGLLVAMADPADALGVNDIAVMTKLDVQPAVAARPALEALLEELPLDDPLEREDTQGSTPADYAAPAVEAPPSVASAAVFWQAADGEAGAQEELPDEVEPAPPASSPENDTGATSSELEALRQELAVVEAPLKQARAGSAGTAEVESLREQLSAAGAELDDARSRAREGKEASAALESSSNRLAAMETQLEQALRGSTELEAQLEQARTRSAEREEQLEQARRGSTELEAQLGRARTRTTEIEGELANARAEAEEARQTLAIVESKVDEAAAELRERLADAEASASEVDALRLRLADAEGHAASMRDELATVRSALDQANAEARDSEVLRANITKAKAERDEARDSAREMESELERLRAASEAATRELEEARGRSEAAEQLAEDERERAGRTEQRAMEAEQRLTEADERTERAEQRATQAERSREELDSRVESLSARLEELEDADRRAEHARLALAELREESDREREQSAISERDLGAKLSAEEHRRRELEGQLSEVEGAGFAADRAVEELREAQNRMRTALRALAAPDAGGDAAN